jgi:hypothetical protein
MRHLHRSPSRAFVVLSIIVGLALAAQVVALVFRGFSDYLRVQGVEAAVASVLFLVFGIRFRANDKRMSRWPPLLPLAAIAAFGAVKNLYVVTQPHTPFWVSILLLASLAWFLIASAIIWRNEGRHSR